MATDAARAEDGARWRDRVTEFRRVKASELLANPKNWREHPDEQKAAMQGVLESVGIAGTLLARETPEGLELLDGHMRMDMDPEQVWPVAIVDVDDAEAALILATLDPIGEMAGRDEGALQELLATLEPSSDELAALLGDLANDDAQTGSGNLPPGENRPEPQTKGEHLVEIYCTATALEILRPALAKWAEDYGAEIHIS